METEELNYYKHQFPDDLNHMLALRGACLSIMFFTVMSRSHPLRKWIDHFVLIESKLDFLFCLFFHVLIDQALDLTGRSHRGLEIVSGSFGKLPKPKLQGFLATSETAVSPFYALVSAAFWADPCQDTSKKLMAYSKLFRAECDENDVPFEFLVDHAIADDALWFASSYYGFAQTAYFLHRIPDLQLLQSWSSLLLGEFGLE